MGEVREGATLRRHNRAGSSTWWIIGDTRLGLLSKVVLIGCLRINGNLEFYRCILLGNFLYFHNQWRSFKKSSIGSFFKILISASAWGTESNGLLK